MTAIRYIGPTSAEVGVVPLPEGWPALGHEEADEDVLAAKLRFRFDETYLPGWGGRPAYEGPRARKPAGEEE